MLTDSALDRGYEISLDQLVQELRRKVPDVDEVAVVV